MTARDAPYIGPVSFSRSIRSSPNRLARLLASRAHRVRRAWLVLAVSAADRRGGRLIPTEKRVLSALTWRSHYKVLRTQWLDELVGLGELVRPEAVGSLASPSSVDGPKPSVSDRRLPSVRLYEFRNATVGAYSSSLVVDDSFVIERADVDDQARIVYEAPGIKYVGDRLSLVVEEPLDLLSDGVFMGGNGAFNYYHFVVEIMAKIAYMPQSVIDSSALLLPEEVESHGQFKDLVELICPGARIEILRRSQHYRVERLFWLTQPSNLPFNISPDAKLTPQDCYLDNQSLQMIRDRALDRLSDLALPRGPSRVFLARSSAKRGYNQEEIIDVADALGFSIVFPETLSLLEQVNLFHSADFIIGPSGAAWTNLLFGRDGAQAMYWVDADMVEYSAWTTLGHLFGIDVRYLSYIPNRESEAGANTVSYCIDSTLVADAIRRLLGPC